MKSKIKKEPSRKKKPPFFSFSFTLYAISFQQQRRYCSHCFKTPETNTTRFYAHISRRKKTMGNDEKDTTARLADAGTTAGSTKVCENEPSRNYNSGSSLV